MKERTSSLPELKGRMIIIRNSTDLRYPWRESLQDGELLSFLLTQTRVKCIPELIKTVLQNHSPEAVMALVDYALQTMLESAQDEESPDSSEIIHINSHLSACLLESDSKKCLSILKHCHEAFQKEEKVLQLTTSLFTKDLSPMLNEDVLAFVFSNLNTENLDIVKIIKALIDKDDLKAVKKLTELGVFKKPAQIDKAIAYASETKKTKMLEWLTNFKNETTPDKKQKPKQ